MKHRILLGIPFVLSAAYLAYSIVYWGGASSNAGSSAEAVGAAIASWLVMPHPICTFIAFIFNALAVFMERRPFALVAGILYAVAMVLFPTYFMFVVVQTVLCFVGFGLMKKQPKRDSAE